jgi:hypothetical protein
MDSVRTESERCQHVSTQHIADHSSGICVSSDFSGHDTGVVESALSKAYTGSELNTLVKNLGLTAGNAAPVYFRLSVKTGDNMTPVYSNVVASEHHSLYHRYERRLHPRQ